MTRTLKRIAPLAALTALVAVALVGPGTASAAPAPKTDICHQKGNGSYNLISVSGNAAAAHQAHGDAMPGDVVGNQRLDDDCELQDATRVTSPPLSFGPNGWGGWSCPTGTTAVGGGTSLSSVSDEGVAAPGADPVDGFSYPAYPHYTFSPGETGYVVHNDNDSETGTVFVDCV
jgi:hypothetical protein